MSPLASRRLPPASGAQRAERQIRGGRGNERFVLALSPERKLRSPGGLEQSPNTAPGIRSTPQASRSPAKEEAPRGLFSVWTGSGQFSPGTAHPSPIIASAAFGLTADHVIFALAFVLNASHSSFRSSRCSWMRAFKASTPSSNDAFSADVTSA